MLRKIAFMIVVCAVSLKSSLNALQVRMNAETCGIPKGQSGLIFKGKDIPRGSFPWLVALKLSRSPYRFFCAGSLVSKTFVISAAHCFLEKHGIKPLLPRNILALFGAHNLNNAEEIGRTLLSPQNIHLHDDWNSSSGNYDADLSLLEFEPNKIKFDDFIQPICLWPSEKKRTLTGGIVAGWGKSEGFGANHENLPKQIQVLIQTNGDCFLETKNLVDLSSNRTFCAGMRDGSGVCHGDSGGGLFVKVNEIFYLKGIVSSSLHSNGVCDVIKDAVYTNVPKFKDWIGKIAGSTLIYFTQGSLDVWCTFAMIHSIDNRKSLNSCMVNQTIDSEDYVFRSPFNDSIEHFVISDNRAVKFLLGRIGEKFPNLRELWAARCGLIVVREYFFRDMRNLLYLNMNDNEIQSIEPNAFQDLVKVQDLMLHYNQIQTLDAKLFFPMVDLKWLYLNNNRIKFVSPSTFEIPNGKLEVLNLRGNVCIDERYASTTWDQLKNSLRTNCTDRAGFIVFENI